MALPMPLAAPTLATLRQRCTMFGSGIPDDLAEGVSGFPTLNLRTSDQSKNKNSGPAVIAELEFLCRGGETRTLGLMVPNHARYQPAPHPETLTSLNHYTI